MTPSETAAITDSVWCIKDRYVNAYLFKGEKNYLLFDVKILHTPGHNPGSSCYIIGNDYLLTGDNLIVKDGVYTHFADAFNMNTEQETESMKRLPDPDHFKYILTAHYGISKTGN